MRYALVETDIGTFGLAWTDDGLARVALPGRDRAGTELWISRDPAEPGFADGPVAGLPERIRRYARGEREDFTDGTRRWDVIVDTAGRRPLRRLRRALTPKGTVAIVGGEGGGRWTGGFLGMMLRAPTLSLFTGQRFRPVVSTEKLDDLRALADLIETGSVTPVVGKTFPLVDAAEAIRELERGHARGKIVVTV